MKRKVLTYFLCLNMAVTCVPSLGVTVHAEGTTTETGVVEDTKIEAGTTENVAANDASTENELTEDAITDIADEVSEETAEDNTQKYWVKIEAESGSLKGAATTEDPTNVAGNAVIVKNLDGGRAKASVSINVEAPFEGEAKMKVAFRATNPGRDLCYEVNGDGTQTTDEWTALDSGAWSTIKESGEKAVTLQEGSNTIEFFAKGESNAPDIDYITFSWNGGTEEDMKPQEGELSVEFRKDGQIVKTLTEDELSDGIISEEELPTEEELNVVAGDTQEDKDFLGWFWGPNDKYEGTFPMNVQDAREHNGIESGNKLYFDARYGKHADGYSVEKVENEFGQRLIFEDNFDGNGLNSDKWVDKYLSSWSDTWKRTQSYEFHPEDTENNGSMNLIIDKTTEPWCVEFDQQTVISGFTTGDRNGLHNWNGGRNQVRNPHDTELTHINQYGYYEMRMKGQPGSSRHSAWWLLGFEDVPEESAEIDIFEVQGQYEGTNQPALHGWNDKDAFPSGNPSGFNDSSKDLHSEWHVYGFNWIEGGGSGNFPDKMEFYLDGVKYGEKNVNINYPMIQLFSQYEKREGGWTGPWEWEPYPNSMEIDYVRVYKDVPEEYRTVTNPEITEVIVEDIEIAQKDIELKTYPGQGGGENGGDYVEKNLPGTKSYVRVEWSDGVQTQEPVRWEPVTDADLAALKNGETVEKKGTVTITSEPDKGAYTYGKPVTMTITPEPAPAWASVGISDVANNIGHMFNGVTETNGDSAEFQVEGSSKNEQIANMEAGKAYITYDFKQDVLLSGIDLWTNYGEKQGITEFDVYVWDDTVSTDDNGEAWKKIESDKSDSEEADGRFHVTWNTANDTIEKQNVEFAPVSTSKVKLVIRDAGLEWAANGGAAKKIAMREIGFDAITSIDLTKEPTTTEYTEGDPELIADGLQLTGTRYYANPELNFDIPAEKDVVIHIPCKDAECGNKSECEKYSEENINFNDYDLNKAGEYNVKISYAGLDVNDTFKITVNEKALEINKAPIIKGAKERELNVGDSFNPKEGITATDAEDGDLTEEIQIESNVDTTQAGEYKVVYTVTDSKGASATVEIKVTVIKKAVKPEVINRIPTIKGAKDIELTVGDKFDPLKGVTAHDAEDGDLTKDIVVKSNVDTAKAGKYEVVYTVTDSKGASATVEIKVTVKEKAVKPEVINKVPVIKGAKDVELTVGDKFDPLKGVTAHDAEDGDITKDIVVKSNVDTTKAGKYEVVYTVTDSKGAIAIKTIKVTVKAKVVKPEVINKVPVIKGAKDVELTVGDEFDPLKGVTAHDAEDGDLTKDIVVKSNVDTAKAGKYEVVYTVTDSKGAIAIKTIKVTVKAKVVKPEVINKVPVIKGAKDVELTVGDKFDPLKGVTAHDAEDGDLTKDIVVKSHVDTTKAGKYEVVYTVTDSKGATATKTIKVTVKAKVVKPEVINKVPVIKGAKDVELTVGDKFDPLKGVTAQDAEDGDITKDIVVKSNVDTTKAGEYEVVYTVTDSKGATATKTIKVTVNAKVVKPGNNNNDNNNGGNDGSNTDKDEAVQTGDTFNIGFWALLMSMAGVFIGLFFKRKVRR